MTSITSTTPTTAKLIFIIYYFGYINKAGRSPAAAEKYYWHKTVYT